jgi:hypothetical protein
MPKCRRKDNARMYPKDRGWDGVAWTHQGRDEEYWWALVNTACEMSLRVP